MNVVTLRNIFNKMHPDDQTLFKSAKGIIDPFQNFYFWMAGMSGWFDHKTDSSRLK